MNKIILIDDSHAKGWGEAFKLIFERTYKDLIVFEVLTDISNDNIEKCYQDNPGAVFIQDNQLGAGVLPGILWAEKYAHCRCIIMHTADADVGFTAGIMGVKYFMAKDNPMYPKSPQEMQDMIIEFHKTIIKHFKLIPELIWVVYMQMGMVDTIEEVLDNKNQ